MANPDDEWRRDAQEWREEAERFGAGRGPRYFGTGSYRIGGSNFEGGYGLEPWDPRGQYGDFDQAGGYGKSALYGQASGFDEVSRAAGPRRFTGPKGYQRSDERIREDICEALMQERDIDSGDVSVAVREAHVELTGSVPERRMKHAIEDLADACPGVREVDNRIRVQRVDRWPHDSGQSARGGDPLERDV